MKKKLFDLIIKKKPTSPPYSTLRHCKLSNILCQNREFVESISQQMSPQSIVCTCAENIPHNHILNICTVYTQKKGKQQIYQHQCYRTKDSYMNMCRYIHIIHKLFPINGKHIKICKSVGVRT